MVHPNGFRQDLFNIANHSNIKYWDASIQWGPSEKWDLAASHRDYRHTSFAELPVEKFTANIVELAVGYRR